MHIDIPDLATCLECDQHGTRECQWHGEFSDYGHDVTTVDMLALCSIAGAALLTAAAIVWRLTS